MYYLTAKNYTDQPMQIHSDRYTSLNYGAIVYKKSAFVLRYLMNYLGEDVFNQCMHAYFDRWKFKHPKPEDMRKVFEEVSKKDLSWFFDDVVKTNKQIDYKMDRSEKGLKTTISSRSKTREK